MTKKFECNFCKKSFYKDFFVNANSAVIKCTLCDIKSNCNDEVNAIKIKLIRDEQERSSITESLVLRIDEQYKEIERLGNIIENLSPSSSAIFSDGTSASYSEKLSSPYSRRNPASSDFQVVKKGAKSTPAKSSSPIPTANSFALLSDDFPAIIPNQTTPKKVPNRSTDNETEVILVGDSMFHGQKDFSKTYKKSKVFSYGGASLTGQKRLTGKSKEFTDSTNKDSLFVVHVGTNDLMSKRSTPLEILTKYKELVQSMKQKSGSGKICVLGLLPVPRETLAETTHRKNFNVALHNMANQENILFLSA